MIAGIAVVTGSFEHLLLPVHPAISYHHIVEAGLTLWLLIMAVKVGDAEAVCRADAPSDQGRGRGLVNGPLVNAIGACSGTVPIE